MKKLVLLLLVLQSFWGYSQKIAITKEAGQKKVYEYVLQNLKELKKEFNIDAVCVKILYRKHYQIDKIVYYKFDKELKGDYENQQEISIPSDLDTIIKENFGFFKRNFFDDAKAVFTSYSFTIPFSKEILTEGLLHYEQNYPLKKEISYNINPNSKFQLKINALRFYKTVITNENIKDKLSYLNSEAIEIARNFYFVFRIINTSYFYFNKEEPLTYLEYKLFYIKNYKQYEVTYGREQIQNKKITITEIPVHRREDLLDDFYCPETDEIETNYLDELKLTFNFDLQFE